MVGLINGCASLYSVYYVDSTDGKDVNKLSVVVPAEGDPLLIKGDKQEEDSVRMLEDGYAMVGYSSFNAGKVPESGAIAQAKKVHASVVLVYVNYTNTESGSMPLTLPDTQRSQTSVYGNAYGTGGGYATYSGNAYTTTSGTKTTYIPYNVRQYDYIATYWVKLKPPIFGAYLAELTTELRQEIGSNKGMLINAVVKDSPAFQADIIRGDILRQIGDIQIYSQDTFEEALERHKGQVVTTLIYRNGTEIKKNVALNAGG